MTLDFGSGHDLTVHEFEPCVRFCADSEEPTWDSLSLPLSVSLSLSLKKTLKKIYPVRAQMSLIGSKSRVSLCAFTGYLNQNSDKVHTINKQYDF